MRIVIRKEEKYDLIRPFWFVMMMDIFIWISEVVFGKMFSSQIKSSREDADFWLIVRLAWGIRRCMIVGKYPSWLENLKEFDGWLNFRFWVMLLISSARIKPRIVIARAVIFRYWGMVICGIVVGGMLLEMINPAKRLPISRRLMGLVRVGLFSLIVIRVGNRGCPRSAKKIVRVL